MLKLNPKSKKIKSLLYEVLSGKNGPFARQSRIRTDELQKKAVDLQRPTA